jgi:pyrroline-5-carboxylate reductase
MKIEILGYGEIGQAIHEKSIAIIGQARIRRWFFNDSLY